MGNSPNSSTPPWLSNNKVGSAAARLALGASWMKSPTSSVLAETGVVEGSSPGASVSGNSIVVTPHSVIVEGASGTFVCVTAANLTCPLDTPLPSAGQSRWDLIVAEVTGSSDTWDYRLRSVTGTASASPSVPSTPANTTVLFRVQVTNSGPQTPIAVFGWTRAPGGIRLCRDGDTRNGSFVGDLRKFTNGQIDRWNGSGWDAIVAPVAWSQFTPVLYSDQGGDPYAQTMGVGGSAIGRYLIEGKKMHLRYVFRRGSSGFLGGYGGIYTLLPPGISSAPAEETHILAKLNAHRLASNQFYGIYQGLCFIPSNSNKMNLYMPTSNTDGRLNDYKYSVSGGSGTGTPNIPSDFPTPGILVIQGTIEIS